MCSLPLSFLPGKGWQLMYLSVGESADFIWRPQEIIQASSKHFLHVFLEENQQFFFFLFQASLACLSQEGCCKKQVQEQRLMRMKTRRKAPPFFFWRGISWFWRLTLILLVTYTRGVMQEYALTYQNEIKSQKNRMFQTNFFWGWWKTRFDVKRKRLNCLPFEPFVC